MKYTIMKLAVLPLLLLAAACGGLPSNGQVGVTAKVIGLQAGTDPVAGGFDVTAGYKSATMAYNPNTTGGKKAENKQILSSNYGEATDSRSMLFWTDAEAQAGGSGAVVGFGDGVAFGPAAAVFGCQMGNTASEVKIDCMEMFK